MSVRSEADIMSKISSSGEMRLTLLFLRSRQVPRTLLLMAGIGIAAILWLSLDTAGEITLLMLPILAPLAAASVIGVATASPFGENEVIVSRPLWTWRLAHLMGLLLIGSLVVTLAVSSWDLPYVGQSVVRNLAGFAGLSLTAAWLLGSAISWSIPFAYAVFVLLLPKPDAIPIWAWPLSAGNDLPASLAASALLLVGLCLVTWRGTRDNIQEAA